MSSQNTNLEFAADVLKEYATQIPLAGPFIGALKNKWIESREARLREFSARVYGGGEPTRDDLAKLNEPENDEYVLAIVKHLLSDDEKRKAAIYAEAFKALLAGQIPEDYKDDLIAAVAQLRFSDFQLLERVERIAGPVRAKFYAENQGPGRPGWLVGQLRVSLEAVTGRHAPGDVGPKVQRLVLAGVLKESGESAPIPFPGLYELLVNLLDVEKPIPRLVYTPA